MRKQRCPNFSSYSIIPFLLRYFDAMRLLLFSFSMFSGLFVNGQAYDTVSVYFELDEPQHFEESVLTSFIQSNEDASITKVIGYTDQLGNETYNQRLSKERATSVAAFLLSQPNMSIYSNDIIGGGVIPGLIGDPKEGNPKNRRVDVVFKRTTALAKPELPVKTTIQPQRVEDSPASLDPTALSALDIDTTKEANIILEGVGFIPGRHYPLPESRPQLERLLLTMKKYPTLKIEIQGFICCDYTQFDGMDSDTETLNLSENRAKFIYDFLLREGIDAERISYKGYGSSRPKVFPEWTEEDKQINRRVEIRVIK